MHKVYKSIQHMRVMNCVPIKRVPNVVMNEFDKG